MGIHMKGIWKMRFWDDIEQKAVTLNIYIRHYNNRYLVDSIMVESVFRSKHKLYRLGYVI